MPSSESSTQRASVPDRRRTVARRAPRPNPRRPPHRRLDASTAGRPRASCLSGTNVVTTSARREPASSSSDTRTRDRRSAAESGRGTRPSGSRGQRPGLRRAAAGQHDLAVEPLQRPADLAPPGRGPVVGDGQRNRVRLHLGGEQHRGVEPPRGVLQGLPAAEVVDARPRGDRPAVVELPVQRPAAAASLPPPVLHADPHRLGMEDLAQVHERREILGQPELLGHVVEDAGVADRAALMMVEQRRAQVPVGRIGREGGDRRQRRQRLEAELADEPVGLVAVGGERRKGVPHDPLVLVAAIAADRLRQRPSRRRRARPVGSGRVLRRDPRRQRVGEEAQVGRAQVLVAGPAPAPVRPAPLHLVVAAPQRQAGPMPQPPDLLADLDLEVGQELRVGQRVDAAGEHEVLPDQDSEAVAQVVERLGLVVAAAPDPDHVVVGGRRRAQSASSRSG